MTQISRSIARNKEMIVEDLKPEKKRYTTEKDPEIIGLEQTEARH